MSEFLAQPEPVSPPPPGASARQAPAAGATPLQQRLIAILEVLLCSSVPTQLTIGYLLTLGGFAATTANGAPSPSYVLTLLFADTLVLIVLMVALMHAHGEDATSLWVGPRSIKRETLIGIALIPAVFIFVVVLLNGLRLFFPGLHNVTTNPLETMAGGSATNAALFGLIAIVAGGVREELQRAFVLHRFEQHLGGAMVGVVVWNAAFGLGHYVQGWDAVVTTAALGVFWGLLFLDRRSSVAPVVSHAGFNSLEILRVVLGAS